MPIRAWKTQTLGMRCLLLLLCISAFAALVAEVEGEPAHAQSIVTMKDAMCAFRQEACSNGPKALSRSHAMSEKFNKHA